MAKKLTLLAMAVVAIAAFAVPSMASAAKLTHGKTPVLVPVGTTITATSTNTVTETTLGKLTCTNVTIHGLVTENTGGSGTTGSVKVAMDEKEGKSVDTASGCLLNGVIPLTIDPTLNSLSGSGTGPGAASFNFNVTGICEAASGASEVTWNGTSTIHIKSAVTGTCGAGTLNGDFVLSDSTSAVIAES